MALPNDESALAGARPMSFRMGMREEPDVLDHDLRVPLYPQGVSAPVNDAPQSVLAFSERPLLASSKWCWLRK